MSTNYDPRDLVLLVSSFAVTFDSSTDSEDRVGLTIEHADFLREVAEEIANARRAWPDAPILWAYDVAEPLGDLLGSLEAAKRRPTFAEVRDHILRLIREAC